MLSDYNQHLTLANTENSLEIISKILKKKKKTYFAESSWRPIVLALEPVVCRHGPCLVELHGQHLSGSGPGTGRKVGSNFVWRGKWENSKRLWTFQLETEKWALISSATTQKEREVFHVEGISEVISSKSREAEDWGQLQTVGILRCWDYQVFKDPPLKAFGTTLRSGNNLNGRIARRKPGELADCCLIPRYEPECMGVWASKWGTGWSWLI